MCSISNLAMKDGYTSADQDQGHRLMAEPLDYAIQTVSRNVTVTVFSIFAHCSCKDYVAQGNQYYEKQAWHERMSTSQHTERYVCADFKRSFMRMAWNYYLVRTDYAGKIHYHVIHFC